MHLKRDTMSLTFGAVTASKLGHKLQHHRENDLIQNNLQERRSEKE